MYNKLRSCSSILFLITLHSNNCYMLTRPAPKKLFDLHQTRSISTISTSYMMSKSNTNSVDLNILSKEKETLEIKMDQISSELKIISNQILEANSMILKNNKDDKIFWLEDKKCLRNNEKILYKEKEVLLLDKKRLMNKIDNLLSIANHNNTDKKRITFRMFDRETNDYILENKIFSSKEDFNNFIKGYDVKCFKEIKAKIISDNINTISNEDMTSMEPINSLDMIKNEGIYIAYLKYDHERNRHQIDDTILGKESSIALKNALKHYYPNIHLHNNLKLFDHKNPIAEYDCILHGDTENITNSVGYLIESKYKIHKNDIDKFYQKWIDLKTYVKEKKRFKCNINGKESDFSHFHNMNAIIPCIASAYWGEEVLELQKYCQEKGFVTISLSGNRYIVENLNLS